jgi:hypothetical protein
MLLRIKQQGLDITPKILIVCFEITLLDFHFQIPLSVCCERVSKCAHPILFYAGNQVVA